MDIYFKHIRDYYCLQGFQCDNDYVSDIIKWWFYKLVEIKLKEKSYDIETEIHVTLIYICKSQPVVLCKGILSLR